MRVVIILMAALLSACASSSPPNAIGAIMSPLCVFNCVTVIHYANGVETMTESPRITKVNH